MNKEVVVCKFGGSSLANAGQFKKVRAIINSSPARRVVVVSAPGKDERYSVKVTDRLIEAWDQHKAGKDWAIPWQEIWVRFAEIAAELGLKTQLGTHFSQIEKQIRNGKASYEYVVSRGEYLSALLMAEYLGFEFVDAAKAVFFDNSRNVHPITYEKIEQFCHDGNGWVIPGFYGNHGHMTAIFPRNGSDISGAVVAAGLNAGLYENWSDSVLRSADPRVVGNPQAISLITYREVRELAYMGAAVLHQDAVEPARERGVPICIMDTNNPDIPGTMIVEDREVGSQVVAGIAGKRGFVRFNLAMPGLHDRVGFAARVLDVFSQLGVSVEHFPTGTDTMSVVVSKDSLGDKSQLVAARLQLLTPKNSVEVCNGIALVAVVGLGMVNHVGTMARITGALVKAGINIQMLTQDFRQTNIIVGVEEVSLDAAIRCIYKEFFERVEI